MKSFYWSLISSFKSNLDTNTQSNLSTKISELKMSVGMHFSGLIQIVKCLNTTKKTLFFWWHFTLQTLFCCIFRFKLFSRYEFSKLFFLMHETFCIRISRRFSEKSFVFFKFKIQVFGIRILNVRVLSIRILNVRILNVRILNFRVLNVRIPNVRVLNSRIIISNNFLNLKDWYSWMEFFQDDTQNLKIKSRKFENQNSISNFNHSKRC